MKLKNIFFIIVALFHSNPVFGRSCKNHKRKNKKQEPQQMITVDLVTNNQVIKKNQKKTESYINSNSKDNTIPPETKLQPDSSDPSPKKSCTILKIYNKQNDPYTSTFSPSYFNNRFGDHLLAFSHTLYISLKNKMELIFTPFLYSDQLKIDDFIKKYSPKIEAEFGDKIIYSCGEMFVEIEHTGEENHPIFLIDWEDKEFKARLRELISPKNDLFLIEPPKDKISVAVYIHKDDNFRNNQKYKSNLSDYNSSHRNISQTPPDNYYVNQIKKASELLNHKPLYVFLFTDDQNPQTLVDKFNLLVDIPSIEFDSRKELNDRYYGVLEDFFSIINFDVLIRPESNFSIMAEKLGNHSIVMSPGDFSQSSMKLEGRIIIKGNFSKKGSINDIN